MKRGFLTGRPRRPYETVSLCIGGFVATGIDVHPQAGLGATGRARQAALRRPRASHGGPLAGVSGLAGGLGQGCSRPGHYHRILRTNPGDGNHPGRAERQWYRATGGKRAWWAVGGGIDGRIDEDRLGLVSIYIQAKRYQEQSVGRPSVQTFSREATDCAAEVKDKKIVLIDGNRLTRLMIDAGVRVSVRETNRVHRLDEDFFAEFEEE